MRRGIICLLLAAAALLTAVFAPQGYALAASANEPIGEAEQQGSPSIPSATDAVSDSDLEYFERVAMVPVNVDVPDFYKQVKNVAGMYIFTMPDGTVHKRIYGSLSGEFGWYIPAGINNIVPMDAEPINIWDDIEMYNEAMEEYTLEQAGKQQGFSGILPPEDKTSGVTAVFGYDVTKLVIGAAAGVTVLCLIILIGSAVSRNKKNKK